MEARNTPNQKQKEYEILEELHQLSMKLLEKHKVLSELRPRVYSMIRVKLFRVVRVNHDGKLEVSNNDDGGNPIQGTFYGAPCDSED